MAELRVGTSGWHYEHWKEVFYPPGLKADERLSFYAGHFDTVEINNTFYRLPSREVFNSWAEKVPPGFIFTVKASRYITHMKKLKAPEKALSSLLDNAAMLGGKLGPILFQLPPSWHRNPSRLDEFIHLLPGGFRYVFEFRDESWFDADIYRILEAGGCALCIASSPGFPAERRFTANFTFLRFHGGEELYSSLYSREELGEWATFTASALDRGRDVYAYFNNDAHAYAVENALAFRELLADS